MAIARNIELKARLQNLEVARKIAQSFATSHLGIQYQTDTYFHCFHGRLKLREIVGQTAQLIWYERPDISDAKGSNYQWIDIPDIIPLKQALAAALGIRVVVAKCRDIFLFNNVRIHLDEVQNLGLFIEFEAVLTGKIDDQAGQSQIAGLMKSFDIASDDVVAGSYADLLHEGSSFGS